MRISRRLRWLALLASSLVVVTACGGSQREAADEGGGTDPGISESEVTIGSTYPFSGSASAYGAIGEGATAYFNYLNEEKGGVDGRQINFMTLDDGYNPARTVEQVKRLVEEEQVFALFNNLGTPPNSAIWDYVNQEEVPHLFVATGASKWGADTDGHPWTTGWQIAYTTEAGIYSEFLQKIKPDAKVAVLYQNDDYGKDYLVGFEKAIEGTEIEIVAEESYEVTDPTVDSQVTTLSRSDADVFFNVTTPKFAAQAIAKADELGWDPIHLLNSVSSSVEAVLKPAGLDASQGVYTVQYLKDPSDPQWKDDPDVQEYFDIVEQHGEGANALDAFTFYGVAVAQTMEYTLKNMEEPTREALVDSARHIDNLEIGLLLPGVTVNTTPEDGYPIEAGQIAQFKGKGYKLVGDVISYEGKTPAGVMGE